MSSMGFRRLAGMGVVLCLLTQVSFAKPSDTGLDPAREIKNQGQYNYCALYAMSSFLELWANAGKKPEERVPALDAAFLAVAFNLEVGTTNLGTPSNAMFATTQKWGIVPQGITGKNWPLKDWRTTQKDLMKSDDAKGILEATYQSDERRYTGREYLRDIVGIDLRDFKGVWTTHRENLKGSPASTTETYRYETKARTDTEIAALAKREGVDMVWTERFADPLYTLTIAQLYQKKPVYVDINVGLVKGSFKDYKTVGSNDLVAVGEGTSGGHAVVAVGHCDRYNATKLPCSQFNESMKAKNVSECMVVQNSWGLDVNSRGYVCISRRALERMMRGAFLLKSILND